MLERVKFWKKDEPSGTDPSYDLGSPSAVDQFAPPTPEQTAPQFTHQEQEFTPQKEFGQQFQQYPTAAPFPGTQRQEQYVEQEAIHPRDIELILAKLDAIKSELDAIHQRVRKLEQVADNQQQQRRYW